MILSVGLVFAKGAGLGDFELLAPAVYVLAVLVRDHRRSSASGTSAGS